MGAPGAVSWRAAGVAIERRRCEQLVTQCKGLGSRTDAELVGEGTVEAFELAKGPVSITPPGEVANDLEVRLLVGGVEPDQVLPLAEPA